MPGAARRPPPPPAGARCAGPGGEPVRALVRLRIAAAHPGEHRLRPVTLPRAGQFHLQDLAADAVLELVPGSLRDHLPPVDDRDPVGQLIGFLQVLGGQQQRRPLAPQLAHDGPDLVAAARIQARGRLVEEQHLRARQQARRDVELAAHAAGVGPGRPVSRLRQVEPLEQLAGAAAGLLAGQLEQAAEHLQVLAPGQQLVDRRELPRQADQLADSGRLPRDVAAEDLRPARIRRQQRGQDADQRGLARPVRAEQAKHHPRWDLEPGTIQRHGRPEALDHPLDPHRRHRRTTSVQPGLWARSRLDSACAVGTSAQLGGGVRGASVDVTCSLSAVMSISSTGPCGSSRQTQVCHQSGDWSSPDRGDPPERKTHAMVAG